MMYSKREWDVSVVTDSGIYKNLRIEGYFTQKDAEAAISFNGKIIDGYMIGVNRVCSTLSLHSY